MKSTDELLDLLAARATEGLSDHESRRLEQLMAEHNGDGRHLEMERAAAAVDLAFQSMENDVEPMPDALKQRILAQAEAHLPSPGVLSFEEHRPAARSGRMGQLGWLAAAAMLVLAIWSSWPTRPEPQTPPLSIAEQRLQLIEQAPDAIRVAWSTPTTEGYEGVDGDVIWSTGKQAGFMRLRGLPANRPNAEQYQLWIVDPSRDTHPIDGGVFDIPAGSGEVIVPIDAKLVVQVPQAFAITLEQPGGVVVSDGPLLVVAAVEA